MVKWGIYWLAPAKMLSLFIAGIALAVGHHCYYRSLAGTKVMPTDIAASAWDIDRQEWKIRFGTAFAFLAKTCLATSIAIAYTQHIWATCREKAYSISGLDAMFNATSDVLAFASADLTLRSKVAALLAALVWLLPLSALITPATLTIVPVLVSDTVSSQVPQIYFPPGSGTGSPVLDAESSNIYLWNSMPSALLTRTSMAAASSMSILSMPPGISNSTYIMSFNGPSLKCEEPNPDLRGAIDQVSQAFEQRVGGNVGSESAYMAFTPNFLGYANYSGNTTDFASFADECILGGATCTFLPGNLSLVYQNGSRNLGRTDPLVIRLAKEDYTCALKNTSYNVQFRSSTEQTSLELVSFNSQDIDPSYDMTYGAVGMAIANILTGTYYFTASRGGGYQDVTMMYLFSARTSIGATALMGLVNEALDPQLPGQGNYVKLPAADLALTKNKTLGEMVEELSRNVTLSFFSDTRLRANTTYTTNITTETQINIYAYNAHNLWIAYGVAIAVTFFSLGVGFYALYHNGISYRTSFSTIVATTRNNVLDEIMVGSSLGGDSVRKDVMQTKLRFGVSDGDQWRGEKTSDRQRAGFGLETQISSLKKGQICY
ncbi:unnamed protein product [Alternaria alternata]